MMRMLHVGGIPAHADNLNSCETGDIKRLPLDQGWLDGCRGWAVKLLEPLYYQPLRRDLPWRFILMRRNPVEQARSQNKLMMLLELGPPQPEQDLVASLRRDYKLMLAYLGQRGPVLVVQFEALLSQPAAEVARVSAFLGVKLDRGAMVAEVRPRSSACYRGLLEATLPELAPSAAAR